MKPHARAFRFFHEWAGYVVGWRAVGALQLAKAEAESSERGWSCEWMGDDECPREQGYPQWLCRLLDERGKLLESLGGIDFGPDGEPWGDPYRRVVEAELALQALEETATAH